jgi:predicted enzyme related to lactoylglutathione lyase
MTRISRHQFGTPCWIDLMTSDPDAARRFYGELFGWTFEVGGPETFYYTTCLKNGLKVAGLSGRPPGMDAPLRWSVYFCVEDADAATRAIEREGGKALFPVMDVLELGRMGSYADPTGVTFGVWQPKSHLGSDLVGEPGAMSWWEVNTRDAVRASKFYGAVFGLEPRRLDAPDIEYYTLNHPEGPAAGVMQITEALDVFPPQWMIYLGSADADAAAAKATTLGGSVKIPPFDTPYGRISVLADPQGVVFSIVRPPAG